MKTGGDHFFFKNIVVARSFTADGNLLQPTGIVNRTPSTRHMFECFSALITMSHVTLAQGVVCVIPSMCHAPVCLISLRLSILHSSQSLPSSTSILLIFIFIFIFHVGRFGEKFPVRFRE